MYLKWGSIAKPSLAGQDQAQLLSVTLEGVSSTVTTKSNQSAFTFLCWTSTEIHSFMQISLLKSHKEKALKFKIMEKNFLDNKMV